MKSKPPSPATLASLRRQAEDQLRKQKSKGQSSTSKVQGLKSEADAQRTLHELQVHQIELEMQNTELQEDRDRLEAQLEKYTDLYDFAPVSYYSLDEQGVVLEANLTGAALLGVERSRLINRRLSRFVVPANQAGFLVFLKHVFAGTGKQNCDMAMVKADGTTVWARFRGTSALSVSDARKWCRVSVADITVIKQAEEAQHCVELLADANRKLAQKIVRRRAVEKALKESAQHKSQMLAQAQRQQEELRQLARQVLSVQEEERKEISRELHDVIAQTLTGINVQLSALKKAATINTKDLDQNIARTQKFVEHSVDIVHRFARELRPAVLDDLGLIPALHLFLKNFTERTGVRTRLTAFAGVEQLDIARRTVLYRIAQEALANVSRHAQASRVEVRLEKLPGGIAMKICDDGKAFNVEKTLLANRGKRLGLLGMRERLQMVGGKFGVVSAPGKGTTVMAQLPFHPASKRGSRHGKKTRV